MMGAERRTLVMTRGREEAHRLSRGGACGGGAERAVRPTPVHKATIIPRGGRALGMVMQLPESDKLSMSYEQMTFAPRDQ